MDIQFFNKKLTDLNNLISVMIDLDMKDESEHVTKYYIDFTEKINHVDNFKNSLTSMKTLITNLDKSLNDKQEFCISKVLSICEEMLEKLDFSHRHSKQDKIIETLEKKINLLKDSLNKADDEIILLDINYKKSLKDNEDLNQILINDKKEVERYKNHLNELENHLSLKNDQILAEKEAVIRLSHLNETNKELHKVIVNLEKTIEDLDDNIIDKNNENSDLLQKNIDLVNSKGVLNIKYVEVENRLKSLEANLLKMSEENLDISKTLNNEIYQLKLELANKNHKLLSYKKPSKEPFTVHDEMTIVNQTEEINSLKKEIDHLKYVNARLQDCDIKLFDQEPKKKCKLCCIC